MIYWDFTGKCETQHFAWKFNQSIINNMLIVHSPNHQVTVIAAQSQIQDGHVKHTIQPLHIFKSGLVHEKCDYPKSCSSWNILLKYAIIHKNHQNPKSCLHWHGLVIMATCWKLFWAKSKTNEQSHTNSPHPWHSLIYMSKWC